MLKQTVLKAPSRRLNRTMHDMCDFAVTYSQDAGSVGTQPLNPGSENCVSRLVIKKPTSDWVLGLARVLHGDMCF